MISLSFYQSTTVSDFLVCLLNEGVVMNRMRRLKASNILFSCCLSWDEFFFPFLCGLKTLFELYCPSSWLWNGALVVKVYDRASRTDRPAGHGRALLLGCVHLWLLRPGICVTLLSEFGYVVVACLFFFCLSQAAGKSPLHPGQTLEPFSFLNHISCHSPVLA